MEPRFRVFAALSLGIHAAVFLGSVVRAREAAPAVSSRAATTSGSGASAAVGGETFEVPELEDVPDEAPGAQAVDELDGPTAPPSADPSGASGAAPQAASASARSTRSRHAVAGAAAPPPPPPAYGAVGDRAAGDLVATFKRVFPIAASSDPLWDRIPVGFYADGEVTFTLETDGTLTHASANAASAPAFREAVSRTVTLLKHRVFTAKGAITRLHMVVRVTDRLVNHGAFTIDAAGSFELPSGRHVSVAITER